MKTALKEKQNQNDYSNENSGNIIMNSDLDLNLHAKRSYSCRVNEQNTKKFSGIEEIRMNISKKFNYLKTPQIKPKKGKLNPIPINIGNVKKKASRFKPLNDDDIDKNIFNDIISEGEKEVSNKGSSCSSSESSDKEEEKDYIENNNDYLENNLNNELNEEYGLLKLNSETKIYSLTGFKIKEENEDEFNHEGNLMLKNVRKKMFQTKKTFLKNDKDSFDITNHLLTEKYQKFKEDILLPKKEEVGFHNTISFSKPKNNAITILEFLRKKSSIDKTKSN